MEIIIGTLSGFVIAFFAEPIKQFIINNMKKNNLHKAIHYEIFHNWSVIEAATNKDDQNLLKDDTILLATKLYLKSGIRNECYLHLINQETALFYQMKEAGNINHLYSYINTIYEWSRISDEESKKFNPKPTIEGFVSDVQELLDTGEIDKKLMGKVIGMKL
jgi:hypothetical protein